MANHKENNFYYLYKLQDCIKTQKFKEKKDMQMILNFSSYNNQITNSKNKTISTKINPSNLFIKNYL